MPVFIFARDALDVVLEGGRQLVVPEDARITMAAWEVIKDHGLEVVYQPPAPSAPAPKEAPAEAERETAAPEEPAAREPAPARPGSPTDEDVELILNRVLERLGQAQGRPVPTAALTPADDDDMVICRCEEITKGEIREAIRTGMVTLNGIKRVTRAGMGLCQGQTCQRLVTQILCQELGLSPADVEPVTARAPVRPVPLSALATG